MLRRISKGRARRVGAVGHWSAVLNDKALDAGLNSKSAGVVIGDSQWLGIALKRVFERVDGFIDVLSKRMLCAKPVIVCLAVQGSVQGYGISCIFFWR